MAGRCRFARFVNLALMFATAAALAACTAGAVSNPPEAAAAVVAPAPAEPPAPPAPPVTRETASTDCWMKYEKDGRGLSLDQRLPLVEKCTAEKLKAAGR